VFFLEESPMELRSVVDFLNRQMERSEVLIVEARQYELEGIRIVVPMLFGYTEQARKIKKTVTTTPRAKQLWNESSFLADLQDRLDEPRSQSVIALYEFCQKLPVDIKWARGLHGSFRLIHPAISPRTFMYVYSDGSIWIDCKNFRGDGRQIDFRDRFAQALTSEFQVTLPEEWESKWISMKIDQWWQRSGALIQLMEGLIREFAVESQTDGPILT
jgi:hypothetical protein